MIFIMIIFSTIPKEWLSDYCLKIANTHKLLHEQLKNYVVHYRNLQQRLKLGMTLKKYTEY